MARTIRTTVSMPDDLAEEAKRLGLNPSRLLQDAIRAEVRRRNAMEQAQEGGDETYVMPVERDGRMVTGRITGRLLAESPRAKVYLTQGRVLVYDVDAQTVTETSDPAGDLNGLLSTGDYLELADALGFEPVIDL